MLCMCLGLIVKQCELCFGFLHSLRPLWPVAKVCPYSKLPLQLHYRQCRYLEIRQFIPAFQGSSIQTDKENSVLIINQFTLNKCFSVGEFAADLAKMTASHLCHKCPGIREQHGAQPKIFLVCREFAKIGLCLRLKSGSAPVLRSSVVILLREEMTVPGRLPLTDGTCMDCLSVFILSPFHNDLFRGDPQHLIQPAVFGACRGKTYQRGFASWACCSGRWQREEGHRHRHTHTRRVM